MEKPPPRLFLPLSELLPVASGGLAGVVRDGPGETSGPRGRWSLGAGLKSPDGRLVSRLVRGLGNRSRVSVSRDWWCGMWLFLQAVRVTVSLQ